MRSYYAHLETAMGTAKKTITPRPVFRSSAIFPVLRLPDISTRILFMGYWILKRNIKQVAAIVTLRSDQGQIVYRTNLSIEEARTYRVEANELLASAGLPDDVTFSGSLEVEFFSTANFVFPYPAVTVNFYGPYFSSVVHTAQRVYNDFEDMRNNSQTQVPESGFNIYADDDHEPFLSMINGPEAIPDGKVTLQFFNLDNETRSIDLDFGKVSPYETKFIYPAKLLDLKGFLKGKTGSGKARFHLNWIFPRLLVGNIQHSKPAVTITHTYYDCTDAKSDSDYWLPQQPGWYPASLMIPAQIDKDHFTNVYFYPIYSPSTIEIDVEIYDSTGQRLGRKPNIIRMESPMNEVKRLNIKEISQELHINPQPDLAVRVIARSMENSRSPHV